MVRIYLPLAAVIFIILHGSGIAQPGPTPSPWSYGPSLSLFYNNGEIDIGTPTGAGTLGPGWFNASGGFAVNGVALPGAFGSQVANKVYAAPCGASGPPTFRAICNGDLPSSLALTGTLGVTGATTLGNTSIGGTLSAAGAVSGAGFASYMTSGLVSGQPGSFSTLYGARLGVGTSALVGDGVTNNNAAFQAALTSVASGGKLILPCGSFLITSQMTVTIAANSKIVLSGSGARCTTIVVQGAVGGIQISLADETSSFEMHDILMTTNQAGGQTAITVQHTSANSLYAYATPNSFTNVSFYGSDYPNSNSPTKYWGTGINLVNINNVDITNEFFIGGGCSSNLCGGIAISYAGLGSASSYGVVLNVQHSNFGLCNTGVFYGDWAQGVVVDDDNFTGCRYGISTVAAPTGALDQLTITNSQFNNFVANINLGMSSGVINGVMISNNLFLVQPNVYGILLTRAVYYTVSGNLISGLSPTGSVGILLGDSIGGNISGNEIGGTGTGMQYGIAIIGSTINTWTYIMNNTVASNTTDYSIAAGVVGIIIHDTLPRAISTLFGCIPGTSGSRAYVSDATAAAVPTYHAAVTGGGSTAVNTPAYCDGTSWKYD